MRVFLELSNEGAMALELLTEDVERSRHKQPGWLTLSLKQNNEIIEWAIRLANAKAIAKAIKSQSTPPREGAKSTI
jgi:hypothetical protein